MKALIPDMILSGKQTPARNAVICLLSAAMTAWAGGAMQGPAKLETAVDWIPEKVDLARFFFVAITVSVPSSELEVVFPPLTGQFDGFSFMGEFERRHELSSGGYLLQRHIRLLPTPGSDRYRLAPLALEWRCHSGNSEIVAGYQTLPAVRFERLATQPAAPMISGGLRRLPVWHERKGLITAFACTLLTVVIGAVMIVRLRRSPPVARRLARSELDNLLNRRLAEQDRPADFYFELTMIVRNYIERRWQIRAPKQTTRELIAAIRDDCRLTASWKNAARIFLEYADPVKYADRRPSRQAVMQAVEAARSLIDSPENGGAPDVATG